MHSMLKFILIAGAALILNACTPSTGNPQLDAFLARVQVIAKEICGIEIVAAQVVATIPIPIITTPVAVATSLCNQVLASRRYGGLASGGTDVVRVRINGNVVDVTVRR